MSFYDRLKESRVNAGYTQEQLAKKIGVAKSTLSGYESGNRDPSMYTISKIMEILNVDANFLWQDEVDAQGGNPVRLKYDEMKHIEKYRTLDIHGKEVVNLILNKEVERILEPKNESPSTVIDIQARQKSNTRIIEYYHSASAGTGVFILGNEAVDQLAIPDIPENRKVDYAIKVSGNSMEPDYCEGEIVLVSQKAELNHGDVGIFIINNDAYIKEYGKTELISRNPKFDNIIVSEHDNIVCMGKVVGKYKT